MVARKYSLETGDTKSIVFKKFFRASLRVIFKDWITVEDTLPLTRFPEYKLKKVKEHIESFPVVDAHYTRKDSNRRFLGHDLNITKMYELYKNERQEEGDEEVTLSMYRHFSITNTIFLFMYQRRANVIFALSTTGLWLMVLLQLQMN